MGQVRCRDKRTGIVYVYESHSYWCKEEKRTKAHRKLIGKLDENGNVVPTSGRRGRLKKNPSIVPNNEEEKEAIKALEESFQKKLNELSEANSKLARELHETKQRQKNLVLGLEKLIQQFKVE